MIVKVNGQEFDSEKTVIIFSFIDNNEMKNMGNMLYNTNELTKDFIIHQKGYAIMGECKLSMDNFK